MNDHPDEVARREARLDEVLAQYLSESEAGPPPDREQFLARYPDLAESIAEFLDDRERINRLVRPAAAATPAPVSGCPHCLSFLATLEGGRSCASCGWRASKESAAGPHAGTVHVGRYELYEVLGQGAFGTVYRGWDPQMKRDVAVKILREHSAAPPDQLHRFLRDPTIAAQLNHPGIVEVHDVGESDGVPYIVSAFVPGRTLGELIRTARPAPERAAFLVARVADALEHAHQKGVIHRDVKPANILLKTDEEPVLTDFGLALWNMADETITEDGRIIGTLAYMSPEQARGQGHGADCRSDVYGLGVVLYELLTGERPFAGTVRGVLYQIEFDPPRSPRALDDRVPRDLETICLKCLKKEPARRYASAAELADDLRRYLAHEPIRARPAGPLERLHLWQRRNRALAATLGLAAVALVAVAAVAVAWALHASRQSDTIRAALRDSQRIRAEVELDRGVAAADLGEVDSGLLWMARSAATVPSGDEGLEWSIRANLRTWAHRHVVLSACRPVPPGVVIGVNPAGTVGWVLAPDRRAVRRWDLATGRPADPTLEHPEDVIGCALSTDGKQVVTTSFEGKQSAVRLWDAATGRLTLTLRPGGRVTAVEFFPDGQKLLTALDEDPPAPATTVFQVWEAGTGKPIGRPFRHSGWITAMSLGSDARFLYTLIHDGKAVNRSKVGDPSANTVLAFPVEVKSLAVSPDGQFLLTGGGDRVARLYELGSGRSVVVGRHRTAISVVAFDPDGRQIVTASSDDALRVWDGVGRLAAPRAAHPGNVRAVSVSPDGKQVVTGADDWHVRIWAVGDGKWNPAGVLPKHRSPLAGVQYAPQGNVLATSTHQNNGAVLWDAIALAPRFPLPHPDRVSQFAFSFEGERVATIGYDQAVRVWSTGTGELLAGPIGSGMATFSVTFSPDGRTLWTGSFDGAVRRWDAHTGQARGEPMWHVAGLPVFAVAASPDGRFVVSGGADGARLWEAESGKVCGGPLRHTALVRAVAFGPTGRWVVTASDDATARCWSTETGRTVGPALRHDNEVLCVAVEPSGRWLVTGGKDRTARMWPAPEPLVGSPDHLALWVQVRTGAELDEAGGVRVLGPDTWHERCNRLQETGGVPEL